MHGCKSFQKKHYYFLEFPSIFVRYVDNLQWMRNTNVLQFATKSSSGPTLASEDTWMMIKVVNMIDKTNSSKSTLWVNKWGCSVSNSLNCIYFADDKHIFQMTLGTKTSIKLFLLSIKICQTFVILFLTSMKIWLNKVLNFVSEL